MFAVWSRDDQGDFSRAYCLVPLADLLNTNVDAGGNVRCSTDYSSGGVNCASTSRKSPRLSLREKERKHRVENLYYFGACHADIDANEELLGIYSKTLFGTNSAHPADALPHADLLFTYGP